jgi:hypothetical protein
VVCIFFFSNGNLLSLPIEPILGSNLPPEHDV